MRVRVIGLLDGSDDIRFDGDPAAADTMLRAEVPVAMVILAGDSFRSRSRCATCALRPVGAAFGLIHDEGNLG